jgi:hypothetical protein
VITGSAVILGCVPIRNEGEVRADMAQGLGR